jgi:hypothetical protein
MSKRTVLTHRAVGLVLLLERRDLHPGGEVVVDVLALIDVDDLGQLLASMTKARRADTTRRAM